MACANKATAAYRIIFESVVQILHGRTPLVLTSAQLVRSDLGMKGTVLTCMLPVATDSTAGIRFCGGSITQTTS